MIGPLKVNVEALYWEGGGTGHHLFTFLKQKPKSLLSGIMENSMGWQ